MGRVSGARLTPKLQLFVANYLVHYNAARAVKQTYGENPHDRGTEKWERFEASARARGSMLLTKLNVSEAIRVGQKRIRQKFDVDADMVVAELASIAFTRLDQVAPWDEDGSHLMPSSEIGEVHLAAIKGMKFKRTVEVQEGEIDPETKLPKQTVLRVENVEFTMHDKVAALKLLGQHVGMRFGGPRINVEPGGTANVDARNQSLLNVYAKLEDMDPDELVKAALAMPAEEDADGA